MKEVISILISLSFFIASKNLSAYDVMSAINSKEKPLDIKATFIMKSFKGEDKRTTEFISWSKDNGKKQIMWFSKPLEYKNMAFLKIQKDAKTNMTMWYPRYEKLRKISTQNKGKSFMNSDLTYEDLYIRELNDFTYEKLRQELLDSIKCYVIVSTPKEKINSEYSKHRTWISKNNFVPLKEISYDKEGNPEKEKYFHYDLKDGKDIITSMKIVNLKKPGFYTNILIDNITLDSGIDDKIFRENKLKRRP